MVRWLRWHCPPDTGLDIQALSEAEHATSRSRRLPTILTFTRGWGRNIFSFFQTAGTGNRTPASGVKGSGANHYPGPLAHVVTNIWVGASGKQVTCLWYQSLYWIFLNSLIWLASFYIWEPWLANPANTKHSHKFVKCWPTIYDAGPTLNQPWVNVSCLLWTHCIACFYCYL